MSYQRSLAPQTERQKEYAQLRPSAEQKKFIEEAKSGKNILVDACIGSGKTTAIQKLCESLSEDTHILYLTYNKLLKLDAQAKIRRRNITVQNYHGFASIALRKNNLTAGIADMIQTVIRERPPMPRYDILIIDEYQDIEQEISEMLEYIKEANPGIQIIAVGDMEQKIYDKTSLDVARFIQEFLDDHVTLEFTQCFRISKDLAAELGRIWNKEIIGVNPDCKVETMSQYEVISFLAQQNVSDVMCLGARTGAMSKTLNALERSYPEKYNKYTVYASISNNGGQTVSPDENAGIFTTFDSSKGMERDICVVFDFDESYWQIRMRQPQQKYTILRNIFCVAASRGKKHIIFVDSGRGHLSEETLSTPPAGKADFKDTSITNLFSFKYKEDVEDTFKLIDKKPLEPVDHDNSIIDIQSTDGLIDLSPCINIFQAAYHFKNYDINSPITMLLEQAYGAGMTRYQKAYSLDKKILLLTHLITSQTRYEDQVNTPFVTPTSSEMLSARLGTRIPRDAEVQIPSGLYFKRHGVNVFAAIGYADARVDDTIYHLCYVDEPSHEDFLECACFVVGSGAKSGILWNTRNNTSWEITIPDKVAFLDSVANTVTKGYLKKYQS